MNTRKPLPISSFKILLILFALASWLMPHQVVGQDVIVLKDSSRLEGSVVEVTELEVRYRLLNESMRRIESIDLAEVDRIKYENGEVLRFNEDEAPKENAWSRWKSKGKSTWTKTRDKFSEPLPPPYRPYLAAGVSRVLPQNEFNDPSDTVDFFGAADATWGYRFEAGTYLKPIPGLGVAVSGGYFRNRMDIGSFTEGLTDDLNGALDFITESGIPLIEDFSTSTTVNGESVWETYYLAVGPMISRTFGRFTFDLQGQVGLAQVKEPTIDIDYVVSYSLDQGFIAIPIPLLTLNIENEQATEQAVVWQGGAGVRFLVHPRVSLKAYANYFYTEPTYNSDLTIGEDGQLSLNREFTAKIETLNYGAMLVYNFR